MTADECQRRADEAKSLAAQTQDLWERETLLHIATLWQLLASHRASKEARQTHGAGSHQIEERRRGGSPAVNNRIPGHGGPRF